MSYQQTIKNNPTGVLPKKKLPLQFISAFIILMGLGLLLYGHTLHYEFQFDDRTSIKQNEAIQDISRLDRLWAGKDRFLTYLSLALNYHFHKLDVSGYHITNLAVHVFCGFLVFFAIFLILKTPALSRQTGLRNLDFQIALWGSILFLAHPLQTQAVTYIIQRAASLATLFYLLTVVLYLLYRLKKNNFFYFCALASTAASYFTKPTAYTLPLILLTCEIILLQPGSHEKRKYFFKLIPFFLTWAIIPYLYGLSPENLGLDSISKTAQDTEVSFSRWDYLLTQFNVIRTYLRLLVLPVRQNLDYAYPLAKSLGEPQTLASFILLAGLFWLAIRVYKKLPFLSFGILWFFITLSVESSIIPIKDVIFEHRLYLPMFGFALIVVISLFSYILNSFVRNSILIAITLLLSILTFQRNLVWKDEITMWRDVIHKSPQNARAYNNLGVVYSDLGQEDLAIPMLLKTIELSPQHRTAYWQLGKALQAKGLTDEAMEAYQKALTIDPKAAEAAINLGGIFFKNKKDYRQAIHYWLQAIDMNPEDASEIHKNLGMAYCKLAEYPSGIDHFKKAIESNNKNPRYYRYLADAYLAAKDRPNAKKQVTVLRQMGETQMAEGLESLLRSNTDQ